MVFLHVVVFRTNNVSDEVLNACGDILNKVFDDIFVEFDRDPLLIPDALYDVRRHQYIAEGVVYLISMRLRRNAYGIILAGVDAYVPGLNFVFGLALPSLRSAAVFTERLKLHTTVDNFLLRVQKEVVHEFGHLLGLSHCSVPTCVMRFSNNVLEVDMKTAYFCRRCAYKLGTRGVKVKTP